MSSNAPSISSAPADSSIYPSEQPFPGAVSAASPPSQPRRTVMEIPALLPQPSFIFRTDGSYSNDADRLFSGWATRLTRYIGANPAAQDVDGIQHPRCFLLSAACKQHDIVYIVMHHRYCTWSRDKEAAYRLMWPFAPSAIDGVFTSLSVLLKSNDALLPTEVEWFSNFPASTFDAYIPSPILASITKEIFEFLSNFAAQWHGFQARIIARDFPVLIWEVANTLRCSSRTVQDLIFTLSRRILGCPDGYFSNALNDLFQSDRHFESAIAPTLASPDHIQQARNTLVTKYICLIRQIRSSTHNTSPSLAAGMPRAQAAQETIQSLSNPNPVITRVASRFPGAEPRVFEWSAQSRHFHASTKASLNALLTNPLTRQPVPSTSGPANSIRKIPQYAGTSTAHMPGPGLGSVRPLKDSPFVAQHAQPAVPQNTIPSTPNLATLLDPAPGKVLRRIPESEYPQSAYGLSSLKVGLHLARQRSPRRVPLDMKPAKFYQYVDSLIVQPTKLDVATHLTQIKFSLSKDQVQKLPIRQLHFEFCNFPAVRFENNTLRFRVRVCRFPSGDTEISESKWAETSTFWPAQMHMTINSMPCLLSRKQHFHADLPAEMSSDVKAGYNELHVSLPSLSGNESGHDYFIAVEQITTQNEATVYGRIKGSPRASAEATKEVIKQHYGLRGTKEISLLGSTSNVSVCDPISSKMCDTPVRGVNCKHLGCFDLGNWLQSRPTKPGSAPNEPCLVDCWACPICGGDARPNQLRICDYFSSVVKHLRESGRSETRDITLDENGEWQPVAETPSHLKRESSSQPRGLLHYPRRLSKDVGVIELLDD